MEKYALFVNNATDMLLLPVKSFIGGKVSSATVVDLYFEKAPLSYKIPLTVDSGRGDIVLESISEVFNTYPENTIKFSDVDSFYAVGSVTAVGTFTKIVVK